MLGSADITESETLVGVNRNYNESRSTRRRVSLQKREANDAEENIDDEMSIPSKYKVKNSYDLNKNVDGDSTTFFESKFTNEIDCNSNARVDNIENVYLTSKDNTTYHSLDSFEGVHPIGKNQCYDNSKLEDNNEDLHLYSNMDNEHSNNIPVNIELKTSGMNSIDRHSTVSKKQKVRSNSTARKQNFIDKLYRLLMEGKSREIIDWTDDGIAFRISKKSAFENTVLRHGLFTHGKFSSFVRQLNLYGFKKLNRSYHKMQTNMDVNGNVENNREEVIMKRDSEPGIFYHHYFQRNKPNLLHLIKRNDKNCSIDTTIISSEVQPHRSQNVKDTQKSDWKGNLTYTEGNASNKSTGRILYDADFNRIDEEDSRYNKQLETRKLLPNMNKRSLSMTEANSKHTKQMEKGVDNDYYSEDHNGEHVVNNQESHSSINYRFSEDLATSESNRYSLVDAVIDDATLIQKDIEEVGNLNHVKHILNGILQLVLDIAQVQKQVS